MTEDDRKAIVRRFRDEIWNQARLEAVDEICAPGYVHHFRTSSMVGSQESLKRVVASVQHPTPTLIFTIDLLIAEGEFVAERWTARRRDPDDEGQHAHDVSGIDLYHVVEGRVVEKWGDWDHLRLATPEA